MIFKYWILGNAFFCNIYLFSTQYQNQNSESFFNYVCYLKQLEIDEKEIEACYSYLHNPKKKFQAPYLQNLKKVFEKQLQIRMGDTIVKQSQDFIDKKVSCFMRIFLKDKLKIRKLNPARMDLAQRAIWDPHYHFSSLFADYFPKSKLYLPNFQESYNYLVNNYLKTSNFFTLIQESMEKATFSTLTEAGLYYDNWHISHAGKKLIPILAKHRNDQSLAPPFAVNGYDICGEEQEMCYLSHKTFLENLPKNKILRVHIGETLNPLRGKENMRLFLDEAALYYTSSKPLRIGHGTHISIDDMIRVEKLGYFIEACLSSNKRLGILDKRSEYPLGLMLLLGVNVVIGTDGGSLYSTTLAEEYAHAARNLEKFLMKLQTSNEPVVLPNQDCLRTKHILSLSSKSENIKDLETLVTYNDLKALLDPAIYSRVSVETLVFNALNLLQACYPVR
jgi:hypothetical protein